MNRITKFTIASVLIYGFANPLLGLQNKSSDSGKSNPEYNRIDIEPQSERGSRAKKIVVLAGTTVVMTAATMVLVIQKIIDSAKWSEQQKQNEAALHNKAEIIHRLERKNAQIVVSSNMVPVVFQSGSLLLVTMYATNSNSTLQEIFNAEVIKTGSLKSDISGIMRKIKSELPELNQNTEAFFEKFVTFQLSSPKNTSQKNINSNEPTNQQPSSQETVVLSSEPNPDEIFYKAIEEDDMSKVEMYVNAANFKDFLSENIDSVIPIVMTAIKTHKYETISPVIAKMSPDHFDLSQQGEFAEVLVAVILNQDTNTLKKLLNKLRKFESPSIVEKVVSATIQVYRKDFFQEIKKKINKKEYKTATWQSYFNRNVSEKNINAVNFLLDNHYFAKSFLERIVEIKSKQQLDAAEETIINSIQSKLK